MFELGCNFVSVKIDAIYQTFFTNSQKHISLGYFYWLKRQNGICRSLHQTDECGKRPFLRWVLAQGCSSDHARHSPKCLGPRWRFSKWARLKRQAINLASPRRVRAWGTTPWGSRYVNPETWHTRPDPCRWYHGRPKCVPSTGSSWLRLNNYFFFASKSFIDHPQSITFIFH